MNTNRNICKFLTLALVLVASSVMLFAQQSTPTVVFELERHKGHLGSGSAISPDGNLIAYIGDDNKLYIHNVALKANTLVLDQAEGLDVFTNPTFSPDGLKIAFSASGGTVHYPSDLFSISTDGTGLKRLTTSKAIENPSGGDPRFDRYNDAPVFSPDGTRLAFLARDVIGNTDFTDLIKADGSDRKTLTQGTPVGWSIDGQSIVVTRADADIQEVPLAGGVPVRIASEADADLLGRMSNGDLVERAGLSVQTLSLRPGRASATLRIAATRVASLPNLAQPVLGQTNPTILVLRSMTGTASGRTLLTYSSDDIERIEVIELGGSR